jgi:predicted SnoaL-like aldol condensation-catalyzing enzyme
MSDSIDHCISARACVHLNAEVPDGLERFESLALAENRSLIYDEMVHLLGQGNFVPTLCKTRWEGVPQAQADIFRMEEGLIVEHRDSAEPVPPRIEWMNSRKSQC